MSASVVPGLYDAIVDEVVLQSRQDFLDDGVPEDILQDFKSRWQAKIAATGATAAPAPVDTSVKQEPGKSDESSTNGGSPSMTFQQGGNALAAMRAAQQLQQLQARSNGGIPQHQTDAAVAQLMQQTQQTNGTSDGDNVGTPGSTMNGNGNGSVANGEYLIKTESIDLPASQEMMASTSAQGSSHGGSGNGKKRSLSIKSETERTAPKVKKTKAPRSDIDLDDEAINSDLDDSDDDALRADGDDDDDGDVQTVLCLFDKVQRTKNKWKCVLKDGIVNVNGRDFAFNKANGEFEW